MIPDVSILDAIDSPALFGRWFRDPATWVAWRAFLAAIFGLHMTDDERAIFAAATGRPEPLRQGHNEIWLVVGRRGGKSFILALIAVYLAVFRDWSPYLSPGERGTVMVIATDRRQARVIYRYVRALLTTVPALAPLVERDDDAAVDLSTGISIEVMTASFRSVRGYTVIAALCDEIAFWRTDEFAANPDGEILDALRPAMATVDGAMLLCASSPYAKRGELYRAYRNHYGADHADDPVLVIKASTQMMNPTVSQSVIDEAYERDPAWAAAEYGAEFRSDIETFVAREVVDAATVPGRHEVPPMGGVSYAAFVDPSGGSADSMTLAIAHRDRATKCAIIDAIRERRPPFSPDDVVQEFSALLKEYRCSSIEGDRYAGEWPRERFRTHGIKYEPAAKPKSDLYRDTLPLLNSRQVELLDVPRLTAQLCGLERRTARGGRDSIDHAPGAHDDISNAVAGVIVRVAGRASAAEVFAKIGRAHPLPPTMRRIGLR